MTMNWVFQYIVIRSYSSSYYLNRRDHRELNLINDTDRSYFVAILEAEGGASIHSSKQLYAGKSRMIYSPYVGVANTDYTIIDAIFRIIIMGRGCLKTYFK
jgi:hypothetical protein